jgi:hypothetical protein
MDSDKGISSVGSRAVLNWNFASAYLWVLVTPVIYETAVRFGFKKGSWMNSLAVHLLTSAAVIVAGSCLFVAWNSLLGLADVTITLKLRLIDLTSENLRICRGVLQP